MSDVVFLCALACIVIHELDAIREGEYHFFLDWTGLSDTAAYRLFTALHAPLLV